MQVKQPSQLKREKKKEKLITIPKNTLQNEKNQVKPFVGETVVHVALRIVGIFAVVMGGIASFAAVIGEEEEERELAGCG